MKRAKVLIGLTMVLLLSACGTSANTQNSETGTNTSGAKSTSAGSKIITVGITNTIAGANPINSMDDPLIADIIFPPLVLPNEELSFDMMLAEEVNTTDHQNFTVNLRENAKWTDGEALTADDVLFSAKLIADTNVIAASGQGFNLLQGMDDKGKLEAGASIDQAVEKSDDHTLIFHMKNAVDTNLFLEKIGINLRAVPEHILKDVNPAEVNKDPYMINPTVSYGAFSLKENAKDQYFELAANPDYFLGAPKIDSLFIKILPSANIVAQLKSGELNMNYPSKGNIAPEDYATVEAMDNVRVVTGKPLSIQSLFMNTKRISDARVRQAIVLAFNRELITKNLLRGYGKVIDAPYTSIHPYFDSGLTLTPYDPDKAKQLLQEANYDFSQTLSLVVPTGNKVREQAADILAENLKDIGVKVKVDKFDFVTAANKASVEHDFDLAMFGSTITIDPDISGTYASGALYNFGEYSNPEIDDLLRKGAAETDSAKRKEIYYTIQQILVRDMPSVTIYEQNTFNAVSKNVLVGEPKAIGMMNNVNEWDIAE
ncbi:ABC transporter substrate-binding protein [Paenibacillus odorifer]|uniref:ABC transporter substrate-binding protein n=1 Tax=Paenibacillus odorifer TaxID=189426 RepID=UPI0004F8CA2C|nr:ABC transporter substrate-binding protein [Paenibacillus odorifer]AIQ75842.1 hypothetical protein PODO_22680 [Paenibacillus odorifer]